MSKQPPRRQQRTVLLCAIACVASSASLIAFVLLRGGGDVVLANASSERDVTANMLHRDKLLTNRPLQPRLDSVDGGASCLPGFVRQSARIARSWWSVLSDSSTVSECVRQYFFPRAVDIALIEDSADVCTQPHRFACGRWLDSLDDQRVATLDDLSASGAHTRLVSVYTDAVRDVDSVLHSFAAQCATNAAEKTLEQRIEQRRDAQRYTHESTRLVDESRTLYDSSAAYVNNTLRVLSQQHLTPLTPLSNDDNNNANDDRWLLTVCGLDSDVLSLAALRAWWPLDTSGDYDWSLWLASLERVQRALCRVEYGVVRSHVSHYVDSAVPQIDTWFRRPLCSADIAHSRVNVYDLRAATRVCIALAACTSIQYGIDPHTSTAAQRLFVVRVRVALASDVYSTVHCRRLALVVYASLLQDRYTAYAVDRVARATLRNTLQVLEACVGGTAAMRVMLVESSRDERAALVHCVHPSSASSQRPIIHAALELATRCSYRERWRRGEAFLFETHQAEFAVDNRTVYITPGALQPPWFSVDYAFDTQLARIGFIILQLYATTTHNDNTVVDDACTARSQRDAHVLATLDRCFPDALQQREFWIDLLQLWCVVSPRAWRLDSAAATHALDVDDGMRTDDAMRCAANDDTAQRLTTALRDSTAFMKSYSCSVN